MIVGIVGKIGAGKDTLGTLIANRLKCEKYDISDIVRDEARAAGVSLERAPLTEFSKAMLNSYGNLYFLAKLVARLESLGHDNAVLASVRSPSNVEFLNDVYKNTFELINVFIPSQELRFSRISERADQKDSTDRSVLEENEKVQEEIFSLSKTESLAVARVDNSFGVDQLEEWVNTRYPMVD